jgi:hypothetical protein
VTTIVVSGAVANKHRHGGSVWTRMSWADSLRSLGFDVVFVEELHSGAAVDGAGHRAPAELSANATVFDRAMTDFGLTGACALLDERGRSIRGLSGAALTERLRDAELLVNISGHLRRPELLKLPRRRAFVDLDPGDTQIWHAQGRDVGVAGHELHFTVGANVGTARCPLPTGDLRWRAIRQPVVLDRWPAVDPAFTRYTTVASWRGAYGPLTWNGQSYGVKAHEFRPLSDLPHRTGLAFEIALDVDRADAADVVALREGGWSVVDPQCAATTAGFAGYIRGSGAEFSAAQGVYVHTRTGWCSDRTVRYLACARPALVQDTGLSDTLAVGEGLVTFSSPAEAVDRAAAIVSDYPRHCRAARRLAEEQFAPEPALAPLLEACDL